MATSQIFKDYIVRYRKGDRIYSAGDPGTEMYIVQSGVVEIFRDAAGQRVRLSVMEQGDFFGEMALIESVPHATSAEAIEDAELIEINPLAGLTPGHSDLPIMAAHLGMEYRQLIGEILACALRRLGICSERVAAA